VFIVKSSSIRSAVLTQSTSVRNNGQRDRIAAQRTWRTCVRGVRRMVKPCSVHVGHSKNTHISMR